MDSVNRSPVGLVPLHHIKHSVFAQATDIYSTANDRKYRRQKVYKNHGCAKVVKEAKEALTNTIMPTEDT